MVLQSPEPSVVQSLFASFLSLVCWRVLPPRTPRDLENQAHGHPGTRPRRAQISLHLAAQTPELDDHVIKFQDSGHTRRYPERLSDFHWFLKKSWLVVPLKPLTGLYPPGHTMKMPHACWTTSSEGRQGLSLTPLGSSSPSTGSGGLFSKSDQRNKQSFYSKCYAVM